MPKLLFPSPSRRQMLGAVANGFGALALHGMLNGKARAATGGERSGGVSSILSKSPHFPARAKRIIFLFMQGGPSHIDTFDPKPALERYDGKPPPFERTRVKFSKRGNLMRSPWEFRPCGQSGLPMSDLWQHLPEVADDLCMIHSVCDTNVAHGGATMKLHTGDDTFVRPSMGAWISYGLGTENQDLPSFLTICPSSIHGGVNNWGAAFLPSEHQGVPIGVPGYPNARARDARFKNMTSRLTREQQRVKLDFLAKLHRERSAVVGTDAELEARVQSFELAFRMQAAAPEVMDISRETKATRDLYGLDDSTTEDFGRQCLLARRFAEHGVRFIQVNHSSSLRTVGIPTNEQWDQHSYLEKGHAINAAMVDKPIAGLIQDLKMRGLLDDTLIWWGGEFGRTPTVELKKEKASVGRDHHTDGFTMWLAGGGVKGGFRYGKTDEFGYYTIEDRCTLYDLHATILHLMGLDHEQLTYRHASRDFRLTDVYGEVASKILV